MSYTNANINEQLNAGIYAPLAGVAQPMTESVSDLATALEAGQGVNVTSAGVVSLATDNATHIVVGSNLGLINGSQRVSDATPYAPVGAVGLDIARVVCQVKTGETIVIGSEVAFEAGLLVLATTETQTFIVEIVENDLAQIKFVS